MSVCKKTVALIALALSTLAAQAGTTEVAAPGTWYTFDVSADLANDGGLGWIDINDGTALSFHFRTTDRVRLTVVDGGFSGDSFAVSINGADPVLTSDAAASYPASVGLDFDAALAAGYSSRTWLLEAGDYTVTGSLAASALVDGQPLNATVGALSLALAPVPEPTPLGLLAAGLFALGFVARRRQA